MVGSFGSFRGRICNHASATIRYDMHSHLDSHPSVLPGKQITAVVIESFSCPSWLYGVTVEMHLPIDSTVPAHSTVTWPARCLTSLQHWE